MTGNTQKDKTHTLQNLLETKRQKEIAEKGKKLYRDYLFRVLYQQSNVPTVSILPKFRRKKN